MDKRENLSKNAKKGGNLKKKKKKGENFEKKKEKKIKLGEKEEIRNNYKKMNKNSFTNRNTNTKTIIAKNADLKLKTHILTNNCIYKYEYRK